VNTTTNGRFVAIVRGISWHARSTDTGTRQNAIVVHPLLSCFMQEDSLMLL
jgi:hypothetical protein